MMGLKIDGLLDLRILVIVFELFHDNILNSLGTTNISIGGVSRDSMI